MDPLDVGDGLRAADRGQVALVVVPEGLDVPASEAVPDNAGDVASLLHRDGCKTGERLAGEGDHVADREDLWMVRQRKLSADREASDSVDLRPGGGSQRGRERRRGHAGGPDDRMRADVPA